MIDQSHNLKGKIEAMIQTVTVAQELFSKAALVEGRELATAQKNCDLMRAEALLQDAFATDVRPVIQEWRRVERLAQKSDGGIPPERLSRAHHQGTRGPEFTERLLLCLRALMRSRISRFRFWR